MIRIGYLGPEGTFSHDAVNQYINSCENSSEYQAVDYNNIPDILLGVQNGDVELGIVPTENSIEGAINATLDMLSGDLDLFIIGEMKLKVRQNLLARRGTVLQDIKRILSHPQPVGQCRRYLSSKFPDAQIVYVFSTAGAAIDVSKDGKGTAAIGSMTAAEVYGLEILERDIQDNDNNYTRFVIAGKQAAQRTGNDKTSFVFSVEDEPGSLYKILDIFYLWDINMTRIESRPSKSQLGKYIFYTDIMGHMDDPDVRDALLMVRRKTSFLKLLGSYPRLRED